MTAGTLAILNCSDGDTRISFDAGNPREVEGAKKIVEDMLKRGYHIAVTVDGEMRRATGFDPKTNSYIVVDPPKPTRTEGGSPSRRRAKRLVPAAGTNAIAVGRSAGGGLGVVTWWKAPRSTSGAST